MSDKPYLDKTQKSPNFYEIQWRRFCIWHQLSIKKFKFRDTSQYCLMKNLMRLKGKATTILRERKKRTEKAFGEI